MRDLINKQLILDSFAGKVTVLQRQQIDDWCRNSVNEELFYEWLEEWEKSNLQYVADNASALNRYHNFIVNVHSEEAVAEQDLALPVSGFITRNRSLLGLAASVVLIVGLFVFQKQLLNQTYSTHYGQTRMVTLSDGSQVTLNANSMLRVPRFGFGTKNREVWLEGEALFSVTHTADHKQFVVKTDNAADVVVLGTEFTLFARPRGTKVVLQKGKVEFHYRQAGQPAKQVTLKPGDLVDLKKNGDASLTPVTQPANYAAWRDHRYVFEETSLREITFLFQESFGMNLEIADPEVAALTISGAYPSQSGEELLSIIAEALNIKITRKEDKVLLSQQPF